MIIVVTGGRNYNNRAVIRYRNGDPYNAAAGASRNQKMLDLYQPQWAMAFPGGKGTADMVRRIEAAKIPLWKVSE